MILITVQDIKTCFTGVTMDYSDASAVRGFSIAMKNDVSAMSKSPEDFRLWKIGEFDQDTGKLSAYDVPVLLCDGASFKKGVNDHDVREDLSNK